MNPFAYHTPETQDEVLALLHEHGDNAKLMAGGTALVIMMKQRLVVPETLISLHRLRGLAAVQETDGTLQLGALLTHRAAENAPLVRVTPASAGGDLSPGRHGAHPQCCQRGWGSGAC